MVPSQREDVSIRCRCPLSSKPIIKYYNIFWTCHAGERGDRTSNTATPPVSAGTQKKVQPAVLQTHHNNPIWWSLASLDLQSFALSRSYEGAGGGETSVWGPEQLHIPGVYPQIPAGPDPVVHPEAWIWTQGWGQRSCSSTHVTYALHKTSGPSRPLLPPHLELNLVLLFALRVTSHSSLVTRWGGRFGGAKPVFFLRNHFSETYFLTIPAEGV